MSGVVCEIIIRGNKAQANANALCELGTTTYDGAEVMTDAQQAQAAQIMGEFVAKSDALLQTVLNNP